MRLGLLVPDSVAQPPDRQHQEWVERVVTRGSDGAQPMPHSWVPERLEVPDDALDRLLLRQVSELAGDVVAEPRLRCGHERVSRGARASSRASSPRALATPTWTAVTLYSGQFVAQSEFSVVTTLAPVTGWWKVV